MPKAKTKTPGGVTVSQLQQLQLKCVEALSAEIDAGMAIGEVNQTAIKNALQICRDNNVIAVDDTQDQYERLASLLPTIEPVKTLSRYS